MFIPSSKLASIVALFEQGFCLRAFQAAQQIAPLENWEGTEALLLAGRLLTAVGAPKKGRKLHFRAYRQQPRHWAARYNYARLMLDERGAFATWCFLRRHDQDPSLQKAPRKIRSDWYALHARVLALLRDFDAAAQWLTQAEQIAPTNHWLALEQAQILTLQDRYDEAGKVLATTVQQHPHCRAAIAALAENLVWRGQDHAALTLLAQSLQQVECAHLTQQLVQLQIELGHTTAVTQTLARLAQLTPCPEPEIKNWFLEKQAETAYLSGNYAAAFHAAKQSTVPAMQNFATQLRQPKPDARRVLLPVPFVRQHHLTCAAATLAMMGQYYQTNTDHLGIAADICIDGTTAYNQRTWAVKNGYAVREFRVTWNDAVSLLERGIVFNLGFITHGNAHMCIAIGYDSLRSTLILRDPLERKYIEMDAIQLLAQQQASGPHGIAMIPQAQADALYSVQLTEADEYDARFAIETALRAHQIDHAQQQLLALQKRVGNTRNYLQAHALVAQWLGDYEQLRWCYEKLLEQFPDEIDFIRSRSECLKILGRNDEIRTHLAQACKSKNAHPLLRLDYALELKRDRQQQSQARRCVRRALRQMPAEAHALYAFATVYRDTKNADEILSAYRFAACLNEHDEQYAMGYFLTAHQMNHTAVALSWLTNRAQRLGVQAAAALETLFQALEIANIQHTDFLPRPQIPSPQEKIRYSTNGLPDYLSPHRPQTQFNAETF